MLLLPFLSAVALAANIAWTVIAALLATVGVFLLREPLTVLRRQSLLASSRQLSRSSSGALERRADETAAARSSVIWYGPAVAIGALCLLLRIPLLPLAALGVPAVLIMLISVEMASRNKRQSSIWEMVSAAALATSAPLAWLAAAKPLDARIWWLWGGQAALSAAGMAAVHARIDARAAQAARRSNSRNIALAAQTFLASLAAVCLATSRPWLALAFAVAATIHATDMARLRRTDFLRMPLRRVGLRELALSIVTSALLVLGLR